MLKRFQVALAIPLALAALALDNFALAADAYPSKPIRMVVGLAAGGPSDLLARTIAKGMEKELPGTIVVENKPGAGGIVGAASVVQSPADGYTIEFAAMPAIVFVPLLNEHLPYQREKDLTPVGMLASYDLFLFVDPNLPVKNFADLVKLAKSKPGELTFGSGGVGTSNHLAGELLKRMANIDITHVVYKGNVQAQQDVMTGRVSMMFDFFSTSKQFVDSGMLRMLAATGKTRSRFAPDIPTLQEEGVKGFEMSAWFGLSVRAGTPDAIIKKLNAALRSALKTDEMVRQLTAQSYDVVSSSPEELASRIAADNALWTPVFRSAGIKPE
jgi:tripartite-type tricarboxylate transporter receptor subunit TctC